MKLFIKRYDDVYLRIDGNRNRAPKYLNKKDISSDSSGPLAESGYIELLHDVKKTNN